MTRSHIAFMIGGILVGAVVVYILFRPVGNGKAITNKLDSLRAVVRWKERKEGFYRDSIKAKDVIIAQKHESVIKAEKAVSLAMAGTEQWRQRYYALKKIVPLNARDSLKDLVASGNACDSLVNELDSLAERRKEQVLAVAGELTATQAKVKELDTLNLIISSENRDLKQMDSLHVKNDKILKNKVKRSFLKGTLIGTAIGVVLVLIL